MLLSIGRQVASEGARDAHGRWWPLSLSYEAWKDANAPADPGRRCSSSPVLAGRLGGELLSRGALTITPRWLVRVPESSIVGYHQTGGAGNNRPPQRRLIDLSAADRRSIDAIFAEWLTGLRRRIISHGSPGAEL